jgi:hypothetical protein
MQWRLVQVGIYVPVISPQNFLVLSFSRDLGELITEAWLLRNNLRLYASPLGRSHWPRGLIYELSSPARTLESWIRISLEAWMSVCVYSVCVVLYIGRGPVTGWSPVQGVQPTVYRVKKLKSCQGPTKDCRAIDGWMENETDRCKLIRLANMTPLLIHMLWSEFWIWGKRKRLTNSVHLERAASNVNTKNQSLNLKILKHRIWEEIQKRQNAVIIVIHGGGDFGSLCAVTSKVAL